MQRGFCPNNDLTAMYDAVLIILWRCLTNPLAQGCWADVKRGHLYVWVSAV